MRFINDLHSTDAFFNLAAEEFVLNHSEEDVCRIWQNKNAVVIGKHQALPVEVNTRAAEEKKVQVARRMSGGGTVYHDLGNINFTFIVHNEKGKNWINFDRFTIPVLEILQEIGIPAEKNERNDLLVNGFKVSGNAEHLSQKLGKTIHHGTLLFDSDLKNLGAVLKTPYQKFDGKFVNSKRSKVANIADYTPQPLYLENFRELLVKGLTKRLEANTKSWTPEEIDAIEKLKVLKYATDKWVYGYSPKFSFKTELDKEDLIIQTEKGKIIEIQSAAIELKSLEGMYYNFSQINAALNQLNISNHQMQATLDCIFPL